MSLPDKSLFTVREAGEQLAFSKASVYRLINEGQLEVRRPRPRATPDYTGEHRRAPEAGGPSPARRCGWR
jgi:hypothetical protein